METKFESKIGKLNTNEERVYSFLGNFNNFRQFIPADKVNDFESSEDHCRFSVPGVGQVGLRIIEREPNKTIKVAGEGMGNQQFNLWIQLKEMAADDTRIKLTMKADMNPMIKMMASKPLQNFLDKLVETIEKVPL